MIQAIPAPLITSQYVPSSQTTLYTSPIGTTTIVDSLVVCNPSGGPVTISINFVPSGVSVSNSNLFVQALSIAAGATVKIVGLDQSSKMDQIVMAPGDFISVIAGAASSLSIQASGRQCS